MALRHRKLLRIIDMLLYYRRTEGMVAVSSTPSRWYWPQPENWHCRYMMKPERYTYIHIQILIMMPNSHTNIHWAFLLLFAVCLSVQSASLCGVRWSRHWSADPRPGERLPLVGGHARKTGGHDGERKDWTRLLQVRHGRGEPFLNFTL